jgi:hypothetical protein
VQARHLHRVALLLVAVCLASPVQAAEISFNASKRDDGKLSAFLTITGDIAPGDADRFSKQGTSILEQNMILSGVDLNSGGGAMGDAINIAEHLYNVRRYKVSALVADGATCASAYFLIFVVLGA